MIDAPNSWLDRQAEKQASRELDDLAIVAGVPVSDIECKNAFLTASRTVIHWHKSKPL